MKFQILQENFAKSIVKANRLISQRAQLPILQNLLLETTPEGLEIISSNMEASMIIHANAKIDKKGSICIPAKLLTELVLSLPQETVIVEKKDNQAYIETSRVKAKIPIIPDADFPKPETDEKEKGILIEKDKLVRALAGVTFAAATDEGRPLLTGLKIVSKKENTVFVATDGYRLALKKIKLAFLKDIDIIVPARVLGELVKSSQEEDKEEEIKIIKGKNNQIEFILNQTHIITRLIEGEYPDYKKIIPKEANTKMIADREELKKAVKTASIFAKDNANIVRFQIEKSGLTILANTPQVGENAVTVEVKIEGEVAEIAFNSRFLMEYLNSCQKEEIIFEMTGSLNPGVFKEKGDDSLIHIIMPVRVQS